MRVTVTYSYREYVKEVVDLPKGADLEDKDVIREALEVKGKSFSDDKGWEFDYEWEYASDDEEG